MRRPASAGLRWKVSVHRLSRHRLLTKPRSSRRWRGGQLLAHRHRSGAPSEVGGRVLTTALGRSEERLEGLGFPIAGSLAGETSANEASVLLTLHAEPSVAAARGQGDRHIGALVSVQICQPTRSNLESRSALHVYA